MTLLPALLAVLAVSATFSRTLTLLALWQRKEWRLDRLREHFLSEGIVVQIYGRSEPPILLIGAAACFVLPQMTAALAALAAVNAWGFAKSLRARQPMPVWTHKAVMVAALTIVLLAIAAIAFHTLALPPIAFLLFPLLTPFALTLAWALVRPIDVVLKRRILRTARKLRETRSGLVAIGITGSVGKTTTKELLAHVFADRTPLFTPAHINTELGVASWLTRELPRSPDATLLIAEMGAYRTGEIALMCSVVKPRYGVITMIGSAHVGLFGSMEAIVEAKGELFAALPQDGRAFLNGDSPMADELARRCRCPVTRVSTGGAADVAAYDIEETPTGIRFTADSTQFEVPLHGTHNVTNVLLVIVVARELGMQASDIARRIATFTPPHDTFEVTELAGVTVLKDIYNASPESFRAALAWARAQPHDRKILVTSGILELGERSDRIHGELGALAKDVFAQVAFTSVTHGAAFAAGYGKMPMLVAEQKPDVRSGDLLVCVGRMPQAIIDTMLPPHAA